MTRRSLLSLGFYCLVGCAGRSLDLDDAPPASGGTAGAAPSVLPLEATWQVWVDEQRLYWLTSSGSVQSCLKQDCAATRLTYTKPDKGSTTPTLGMTVAGGHVYWASFASTIFSCPAEGCANAPVVVVRDPALRDDSIFAHHDHVYWSSQLDIYRCARSGCAATPEVVAESAHAEHLVFDETHVYWRGPKEIFSAPKDGSEPPHVVTSAAEVATVFIGVEGPQRGLAVAGGYLYWEAGTQVFRCSIPSCDTAAATRLVTGEAAIMGLKVDDSAMYWLEADSIHSCPIAGCEQSRALTPAKVARVEGLSEFSRYAIDASDLYWLEAPAEPGTTTRPPTTGGVIRRTSK
jgi:hypothetical protein